MRFFSPLLALKIAKGIGMAAAGAAGGAGAHHLYSQSKNKAAPSTQIKEVDPFSEGEKLNKDQIEVAQYLWKRDMNRELIDYEARDAWVQKAQEKSLIAKQWPGDIIFIKDKSDASLAKLLRDKCYSVSRWFLSKQDLTLNDDNLPLKEKFKNAKDSFKLDNLKDLCSTGQGDSKEYLISSANPKGLRSLLNGSYTCDDSIITKNQLPNGHWMKEIYDLKKGGTTNPDACNIVKGNIIVEITYKDGRPKKYEIRKSHKPGSSGYISVPRDDWTLYSSLEDLPEFTQMFTKSR